MKVLKFGGTSVGSLQGILSLKKIVEHSSAKDDVIVVVSALGGVTDQLIRMSEMASMGERSYSELYDQMVMRHRTMIAEVIDPAQRQSVEQRVDCLLAELRDILHGVSLIRDLSEKTLATIVSYGERMSSIIVASLCSAPHLDSRSFIKTTVKESGNMINADLTARLIRETFQETHGVSVCGGFISEDSTTGEITNLGRGGSDYTASLIAAALEADRLEIWTDVDGFMTADPKVIPGAYTIPELSYQEAMELCNFGAKVVYPPTIYPACQRNIPILIKNTFSPQTQGTIIKQNIEASDRSIKGISSIKDTALVTLTGLGMVGIIGVNYRIFRALAGRGISVFLVSQASSENSTSIGVKNSDVDSAIEVLNAEFSREIELGEIHPVSALRNLATVAIVGENMKHTPGVAGKLFGTLGRNGISVKACAQGTSETNLSFVINIENLHKAMNVIHDSFFLSEHQVLNLYVCGVGIVGSSLLDQISSQAENLLRTRNLKLNIVGVSSSRKALCSVEGLSLRSPYREWLTEQGEDSCIENFTHKIISQNLFNSVFVDCTASQEVAAQYQTLLENNISVVAANKIAASSGYAQYDSLKQTALKKGVKFLFETNVGAGLPIISTMNDLKNSGDEILKIEAVLSGTLNFIFNTISRDIPFSQTVRMAQEAGYAEPDPRIDLSGVDVIRKLTILSREAGYCMEQQDVEKHLFLEGKFFEGSLDEFWQHLPEVDSHFEQERQRLESEGKRWRFVAKLENGKGSVSLREIEKGHPFYNLEGSNNIITLTTARYKDYPMLIQGYGAGAGVTAAGVFADIMKIANI